MNLDMNVLPCTSQEEADEVKGKVSGLMRLAEQLEQQIASESSEGGEREECKAEGEHRRGDEVYLKWEGRRVVGTFSGHAAVLGGKGWEGWVKSVEEDLGEEVSLSLSCAGFLCPDRRDSATWYRDMHVKRM